MARKPIHNFLVQRGQSGDVGWQFHVQTNCLKRQQVGRRMVAQNPFGTPASCSPAIRLAAPAPSGSPGSAGVRHGCLQYGIANRQQRSRFRHVHAAAHATSLCEIAT